MITVAALFRIVYYVILSVGAMVVIYGLAMSAWVMYLLGSSFL